MRCFTDSEDDTAEVANPKTYAKVAELLDIDKKRFSWTLRNYCLMEYGTVLQRKTTPDQARDASIFTTILDLNAYKEIIWSNY